MNRQKNSGFSLIEVMVAAGLLATVTVTVCALGARSLESMRVCQEYEKAWDVLDRQMVLLEQIGVANLVSRSSLSGVIDDPQSQIQWKWQMNIEPLNVEELYAFTLTMEWVSEGRVRRIQCDTRLRAGQEAQASDTTTSSSASTTNTAATGASSTSSTSSQGR
jgi:prepilin-type N-terminal cleavage/methylation domain-containing protein